MKRLLIGVGTAAAVAGVAVYSYRLLCRSLDSLTQQETTTDRYRIPADQESVVLNTSQGEVRLVPATGYFAGTAIYVFFPEGRTFSEAIAEAFRATTGGRFIMERPPATGMGGNDFADAIITAGLDHTAYIEGRQGHFKESPAPNMSEVACVLERILLTHTIPAMEPTS